MSYISGNYKKCKWNKTGVNSSNEFAEPNVHARFEH